MYEYGTLKPISHFEKGSGRREKIMKRMNQPRIQYMYA
jgi:hypothetical protein